MKKWFYIFLISMVFSTGLFANDLIVLKDGTMQFGKIQSYDTEIIKFTSLDGASIDYDVEDILTSRMNINIDNIIGQTLSPTYNMITYYPRNNDSAYELPPRFKYKGQIYSMESEWGKTTQILEFFDMLKHEGMDSNTELLVKELESKIDKQQKYFRTIGITQLAGISLLMVPFFAMDDSGTTVSIPTWASITGVVGVAVDIVGLSMLITQINVNQDKYLETIADSFNDNLNNNQI